MEKFRKAKFIVRTLNNKGYQAYFAGGWVRDFLLDLPSDDIDIATNAPPEIIQSLFPNTIPIGLAFGIILVIIEKEKFEVATFRKDIEYIDGRRPSKIECTDVIEDAKRRDFSINGMFYDPINDKILDFVEGKQDIGKQIIKAIGNPNERFKEDRLRMIRAIRLACRLGFSIEKETQKAILKHSSEIMSSVAIERIWQEFCKMANYKGFRKAIISLFEYNLLQAIFPKEFINISIDTIDERSEFLDLLPQETPVIGKFLELFPFTSLEGIESICKYLKLSNEEVRFALFLTTAKQIFAINKLMPLSQWAHFYSNPHSSLCIEIFAVHLNEEEKKLFLQQHNQRKEKLSKAIHRIITKDPIVHSEDLKNLGILPGEIMGLLLKEAEKISIDHSIEKKESILNLLKKSKIWPKET